MRFLVNCLVFAFVCTAVTETLAEGTSPPSTVQQQQQEQQQQQQQQLLTENITIPSTAVASPSPTSTPDATDGGNDTAPSTEASTTITEASTTTTEVPSTTTEAPTATPEAPASSPSTTSAATTTTTTSSVSSSFAETTEVTTTATTMMSVMTTIADDGSPGCDGLPEATQCITAAYQDLWSSVFFFIFDQKVDNLLDSVCWKYPSHRLCVKSALMTCRGPQRLAFDVGMAAMDFVCSSTGRPVLKEAWPCLADRSVGQQLRSCSQLVSTGYGPCVLSSGYIGCVRSTFQQRCSALSADAIQEILTATLAPFSAFFNCSSVSTTVPPTNTNTTANTTAMPTSTTVPNTTSSDTYTTAETTSTTGPPTTSSATNATTVSPNTTSSTRTTAMPSNTTSVSSDTTTTREEVSTTSTTEAPITTTTTVASTRPASIKCFDCNTGAPGYWQNPNCAANGTIKASRVTSTSCSDFCFARRSAHPWGAVFRGCSSGWRYKLRNTNIPSSGCVTVLSGSAPEVWCFCRHDNCNTQDMTPYVDAVFGSLPESV